MTENEITVHDKINELERELGYRAGVYKKLIESGRMKREVATRRYRILQAILKDYEKVKEKSI